MRCLVLFSSFALAASLIASSKSHTREQVSYEDFLRHHGHRQGVSDPVSLAMRRKLYHTRLADIEAHNAKQKSWRAGVNKFADYTDAELRGVLGYKRQARSANGPTGTSLLQIDIEGEGTQVLRSSPKRHLAETVDWRQKLTTSANFFRDQGDCGSCWAVAAAGALEMHAELNHGNTTKLAYKQLVDCVRNPHHCGGDGGCGGATAELAFEYVQKHGLGRDHGYDDSSSCESHHPVVSVHGWHRLPINEAQPLLAAVSEGPVVISVDGSKWFAYGSGIFGDCPKDVVINHAVLAIGYGNEDGKKFWLIRNSWGHGWGEKGHIRIHRHDVHEKYCGIDNDPKEGVGCDGGPEELPVCGMCGILSDSSYPVGTVVKN